MKKHTFLGRHIPVHRDGRATPNRTEQNLNHDKRDRDINRYGFDDDMLA